MDLTPDTVLHNRYRIQSLLGKGGMGAVYLAYDLSLEHEVAVKTNHNLDGESATQFKNEARLLATLKHTNLPRVSDYFFEGDTQCLVMDYIPGDDLKKRLAETGPIPLEQVLRWARQIGSALSYLHRQEPPVFHRDVKPANLRLSPDNEAILVDFGLAKAAPAEQQTAAGAAMYLTPGYAPPEQYGRGHTGAYSDQYSLAATLYNLLTAQAPVDGLARLLGQALLAPPSHYLPGLPAHVERAILRAMSVHPEDRFTNVDEFIQALCDANYQATVRAPASAVSLPPLPPPPENAIPVQGRRPLPRWLIIAGVISLVLVVGGIILFSQVFGKQAAPLPSATAPLAAQATFTRTAASPSPLPLPTKPLLPTATLTLLPEASQTPTVEPTTTLTLTTAPTLPPLGGGRGIAFASDRGDGLVRQIWLMAVGTDSQGKPAATGFTQLTFDKGDKNQPAWSPDGTRLLYVAYGGKASTGVDYGLDIFLLDLSTPNSQPINLTHRAGDDIDPAWSPDGKLIAMTNNGRGDKIPMIDVMAPDGSSLRRVTANLQETNPTWSPDMAWMAYVMYANDLNILKLRELGDYTKTVTFDRKTFTDRTGQVADPNWSPDGSLIAYTRFDGLNRNVYIMPVSSRADVIVKLTSTNRDHEPAFSADSQWVVFTSERDGNSEVYIADLTGKVVVNLSQNGGQDLQPAWRP